jgi:hypothetical protein
MNEGVKLLLERIKTHPEEFMKGGRWIRLLAEYNEYIPDELKPLTDEARKLVADEFTRDVMKELLDSEEEDPFDEVLKRAKHNQSLSAKTIFGRLKYDSVEES